MIGFGNGGSILISGWSASFHAQNVSPLGTSALSADMSYVNAEPGVLAKQVVSSRPQIQRQPVSYFFEPGQDEPSFLTDGSAVDVRYEYPGGDTARVGKVSFEGYSDGGLIDDEIMVGDYTLSWQGGVPLSDLTVRVVPALLLSGQPWVLLDGRGVAVFT